MNVAARETFFFMTTEDTQRFLDFLIAEFRATFLPARNPTPEPPELKSASEVLDNTKRSRHPPCFLVRSERWTLHPPSTARVDNPHLGVFYYVRENIGGPFLELELSRRAPHVRGYLPGVVADRPWYIVDDGFLLDEAKYRTFDRPAALTEAHDGIRRNIRRNGLRTEDTVYGRPGPWAMSGTLEALANGEVLAIGDQRFVPRSRPARRPM